MNWVFIQRGMDEDLMGSNGGNSSVRMSGDV